MGVQVTLQDIQSGFLSASAHTANNTLIEEAFNKALDRTASVGNAMEVELDMGLNKIINLSEGIVNTDGVNLAQLLSRTSSLGSGSVYRLREPRTVATQGQTTIPMSTLSLTSGNLSTDLFVNGVHQVEDIDYEVTSSSLITLLSGASLDAGDVVDIYQITTSV